MSSTRQPKFPELDTTTLPELFRYLVAWPTMNVIRILASRWHDPNCECCFKDGVEKRVCLRCKNVRRMILERL